MAMFDSVTKSHDKIGNIERENSFTTVVFPGSGRAQKNYQVFQQEICTLPKVWRK